MKTYAANLNDLSENVRLAVSAMLLALELNATLQARATTAAAQCARLLMSSLTMSECDELDESGADEIVADFDEQLGL